MKKAMKIMRKVEAYAAAHQLFADGESVLVAVSGGLDSVALLDLLSSLPGARLQLAVAHLNHLLRGEESDADEEFTAELARTRGFPFFCDRVDVHALASSRRISLEDAARVARYAFLREAADRFGARRIALGHHAGDQAETLVMRLLRGSAAGLAAMNPVSGWKVRPLLCVSRGELAEYVEERGLPFREDSSNSDRRFTRNRIRHELLPAMESFNPSVGASLARTAGILAEDNALLDSLADSLLVSARTAPGALDLALLRRAPRPLRMRAYRKCLDEAGGEGEISSLHLFALDELVLSPRSTATVTLPGGCEAVKSYGTLVLRRSLPASPPFAVDIVSTGVHAFPGGSLSIIEAPVPRDPATPRSCTWVDLDAMPFPWSLRSVLRGDRIVPLGMTGSRKVKEVLIDDKVPRELRGRIPLLVGCGGNVVWIGGVRRGEHGRITPQTRRAALLELFPVG